MGNYTVNHIHPRRRFRVSEPFVRGLFDRLGADMLLSVMGDRKPPLLQRIRHAINPPIIEEIGGGEAFFESKVDTDRGIELWRTRAADAVHFLLSYRDESWARRVHAECGELIDDDLANGYVPWDCGMTIGPWRAYDYDTGKVTAKGAFAVRLSANGNPRNLRKYEAAIAGLPAVKELIGYLESQSGTTWSVTCELT